MSSDLPGPSAATSQIVSLDPTTGARTVLTSGPGRKYQPKWVGDGVAYTRGEVDERRGDRQRVNYVAHGISFTDGRAGAAGRVLQRELVFGRQAHGIPSIARRHVATRHAGVQPRSVSLPSSVPASIPSYSPDGRFLMSNTAFAGIYRNTILVMNPDGTNRRVVFEHPEPERARAGVVALGRPHRLRARQFLRRRPCRRVRAPGRRGRRRIRVCEC